MGLAVQNRRHRQIVALADNEVVEIVRGGDLHRAGAFFRVGVGVGDDRDQPAHERQDGVLADQVREGGVLRVHRDRGVAEHRLRAGGGDGDELAGLIVDRIGDVPEAALHLGVLDLEVGDRRLEFRVPVHQPLVAVDQALAIQRDEHLPHGGREAVIHGEALARPVERGAEAAELAGDGAARFRLPLPDPLEEGFAAEGLAGDALFGEQAFDHHLGGDAGVVSAGLPERVPPLHAAPADEGVLKGEREGVAHVQAAGHVRRRDHDGEGLGAGTGIGREGAGFLPAFIQPGFGLVRRMRFVQHVGYPKGARSAGRKSQDWVARARGAVGVGRLGDGAPDHPLQFRADQTLHHRGEVFVEPLLEQRANFGAHDILDRRAAGVDLHRAFRGDRTDQRSNRRCRRRGRGRCDQRCVEGGRGLWWRSRLVGLGVDRRRDGNLRIRGRFRLRVRRLHRCVGRRRITRVGFRIGQHHRGVQRQNIVRRIAVFGRWRVCGRFILTQDPADRGQDVLHGWIAGIGRRRLPRKVLGWVRGGHRIKDPAYY